MKLVKDYPPNFHKIANVLPSAEDKGVIFTYGDTIYSPHDDTISPELEAHEGVHCEQQGDDPDAWWDKYLTDIQFRFEQELEAHAVEYATFCNMPTTRNQRRLFLKSIAKRLASPLYGGLITKEKAMKKIKKLSK